jgi:TonB family protein
MTMRSGRRADETRELWIAVGLSVLLHFVLAGFALLVSYTASTKFLVPVFYEVRLIADQGSRPEAVPEQIAQPQVKQQNKPVPKPVVKPARKPAPHHPEPLPKKSALPSLVEKKTSQPEKQQPAAAAQKQSTQPAATASATAKPGKPEGVTVSPAGPEFKFPAYLAVVRNRIENNWNAPPGSEGESATVQFTIYRSGRVSDVSLTKQSGNFYFDQAAKRAIPQAFPPMPDEFFRDKAIFSVDLTD